MALFCHPFWVGYALGSVTCVQEKWCLVLWLLPWEAEELGLGCLGGICVFY